MHTGREEALLPTGCAMRIGAFCFETFRMLTRRSGRESGWWMGCAVVIRPAMSMVEIVWGLGFEAELWLCISQMESSTGSIFSDG